MKWHHSQILLSSTPIFPYFVCEFPLAFMVISAPVRHLYAFTLFADFLCTLAACFSPRENNSHDPVVCKVLGPGEMQGLRTRRNKLLKMCSPGENSFCTTMILCITRSVMLSIGSCVPKRNVQHYVTSLVSYQTFMTSQFGNPVMKVWSPTDPKSGLTHFKFSRLASCLFSTRSTYVSV